MVLFESYHGTNKTCADRISGEGIKINIPLVANESNKHNKKRYPGSFGYGFYTFLEDHQLASDFAVRMNSEDEARIFQINSEIDEGTLLSLIDKNDRENYHAFHEKAYNIGQNLLERFGTRLDTNVQHVLEGIIIELFLQNLRNKERIVVVAVLGESFTPRGNRVFSHIPNGQELCIRDKNVIKSFKECKSKE